MLQILINFSVLHLSGNSHSKWLLCIWSQFYYLNILKSLQIYILKPQPQAFVTYCYVMAHMLSLILCFPEIQPIKSYAICHFAITIQGIQNQGSGLLFKDFCSEGIFMASSITCCFYRYFCYNFQTDFTYFFLIIGILFSSGLLIRNSNLRNTTT